MVERCHNCGAELYAGAQFCRRCGAAVAGAGDAPTQLFPQGRPTGLPADSAGAATGPTSARTSPLGGQGTESVGPPRATGYQQPLQSFQQTSPLAQPAPRKGRRAVWVVALVVVAALSAVASVGVMMMMNSDEPHRSVVVVKKGGKDVSVDVPPLPPELPKQIREAVASAGVMLPLDESGAQTTDSETTITKSYRLAPGAVFSVRNVSGDISVEGWDGTEAQVKITKRGGDEAARRRVPVLATSREDALALISPEGDGKPVSVSFEIKLPRGVRQVEIASEESDVKVGGLGGMVVVDVKTGELKFGPLSGAVRSKLIKGNTEVAYGADGRKGAQEFSVVRGNVSVTFGGDAKADLKAETMDGDIDVDRAFPLKVEKRPAGQQVVGRLGEGGAPLLIKVVNGDIELKK